MTGDALQRVETALANLGKKTNGKGMWQCPAHGDNNPSLHIGQGDEGAILHCFAGCTVLDIGSALPLSPAELFDSYGENSREPPRTRKPDPVVAHYDYTDEAGTLLYRIDRTAAKQFYPRRPDGHNGWISGRGCLDAVRRVPYRLPELLLAIAADDPIWICEGEKDCDAMHAARHVATCNAGGAGKWSPDWTPLFRGSHVSIVVDQDAPGLAHARLVRDTLANTATNLRCVRAKIGKDAADHLAAGHSPDDFIPYDLDTVNIQPELGFYGDRLRAVLVEPEDVSPVKDLFDPAPHLHLIIAKPKIGKSRLGLHIAQRWAQGLPSWEGNAPIPPSRVLVLSVEQTVKIIGRILMDFQVADLTSWQDEMTILSRHPTTTNEEKKPFTLGTEGQSALEAILVTARASGRPYGLVLIDSLSRIKPHGTEENSNDDMTAWLDQLERIAEKHKAYLLLIHHEGHSEREGAVSAGRGASAITAVPQVIWHLARVKDAPTYRRLTVSGNSVAGSTIEFEVADARIDKPDMIRYWRRTTVSAEYPHAGQFLVELDDQNNRRLYTRNDVALLLAGKSEGKALGREYEHATNVIHHWQRTCQVSDDYQGPKNAKLVALRTDVIGKDGLPLDSTPWTNGRDYDQ